MTEWEDWQIDREASSPEPLQRPSYLDVSQKPNNRAIRITMLVLMTPFAVLALVMLMTHHFGWFVLFLVVAAAIGFVMVALVRDTAIGNREGTSRPNALDNHTPDTATDSAIANMTYDQATWLSRRSSDQ